VIEHAGPRRHRARPATRHRLPTTVATHGINSSIWYGRQR
jgi:hypothetical protein